MCFQSSRLETRTNVNAEAILFEEQDKNLWYQSLIQQGNYYLFNATNGNEVSKYHLERSNVRTKNIKLKKTPLIPVEKVALSLTGYLGTYE